MKVSCLPVSLFDDFSTGKIDIASWAKHAATIGFDGFDISTLFIKNQTPTYLDKVKSSVAAAKIPLVMITSYPDLVHPDPIQRKRETIYLARDIALAAELGAPYLRVLAGQAHPELKRKKGIELALNGLRTAAATAQEFGVTLLYENHAKPGAWKYIDFSYPPDIFLEIADGIRDTPIRINFDIGNATSVATRDGDEIRLLERVADKLETVHVCDMAERGKFTPTLAGTGKTPIREIFSFLKTHAFDGWLCIEEAGGQGMDGVRKAHDFIRSAWDGAV